jgi:hypothetical protein
MTFMVDCRLFLRRCRFSFFQYSTVTAAASIVMEHTNFYPAARKPTGDDVCRYCAKKHLTGGLMSNMKYREMTIA